MNIEHIQGIKPNLIIAGVNKAGTTSVFSYLSKHPEVCGSTVKETCYFLPARYGEDISEFAKYQALFPSDTVCPIIMEATPGYFYGGTDVIQKISEALPNVKIIILLRNPASRLMSFYSFMKSMLLIDQNMTFEDYVTHCNTLDKGELKLQRNNHYFGVEGGYYANYLDSWMEHFGNRLKILFFEDLKSNPTKVMKDIGLWLDIDQSFYDGYNFTVENKTMMPKNKRAQKLAIIVNKKAEVILRALPFLKHSLKNMYSYFFHGNKEVFSDNDKMIAKNLYKQSNYALLYKMKDYGFTEFPSWLEEL